MGPNARRHFGIVGLRNGLHAIGKPLDRSADLRPVVHQVVKPLAVFDEPRVTPLTAATTSRKAWLSYRRLFLSRGGWLLFRLNMPTNDCDPKSKHDDCRFHGAPHVFEEGIATLRRLTIAACPCIALLTQRSSQGHRHGSPRQDIQHRRCEAGVPATSSG
jgi:hypothetical protein